MPVTTSTYIILFFMLATLGILICGIVVMAIGGRIDKKWSNRLMVLRVTFQGIAIALLALMFMSGK